MPDRELDADLARRLLEPLRSIFSASDPKRLARRLRGRRAALRLLQKRIAELEITADGRGTLRALVSRSAWVQRSALHSASVGEVLISRRDLAQPNASGSHEAPDEEEFIVGASKAVKTAVRRLHSRGITTTHLVDGRLVEDAPNGVRRELVDRG